MLLRGLLLLAILGALFCKLRPAFYISLVSLISLRVIVILLSPNPIIDVFHTTQLAEQFFWEGKNPYSFLYPDVYAGASGYPAGFLYPPGVLIYLAPFYKIFGDIRYGLLCADLLISFSLGFWLRKSKLGSRLMPLLWLSFPVSLLILEQAWVDTLLIQWGLLLFLALEGRKFKLMSICLGVLLLTKQYAVLVIPFTWLYLKQNGVELKTRLKLALITAVTGVLIVLPFMVTDFGGVINSLVLMPLRQNIRFDSFSLVSLLHHELQFDLSSLAILMTSLMGLMFSVLIATKKSSFTKRDWAYFNVLAFGIIFFISKQAFCNYYQWLAFFILLHLGMQLKESETLENSH